MNNLSIKALLAITSFLYMGASYAEIYKWTDSNGVVHFGEQPPSQGESEEINVDVVQSTSMKKVDVDIKSAHVKQKKIVMYGTAWCSYCSKARKYFNKKGLKFVEYDVEKSDSKNREFKKLGGSGYPLILIGKDQQMQGFSVEGFEKRFNKES